MMLQNFFSKKKRRFSNNESDEQQQRLKTNKNPNEKLIFIFERQRPTRSNEIIYTQFKWSKNNTCMNREYNHNRAQNGCQVALRIFSYFLSEEFSVKYYCRRFCVMLAYNYYEMIPA